MAFFRRAWLLVLWFYCWLNKSRTSWIRQIRQTSKYSKRFYAYQLVQDFFHQQYHVLSKLSHWSTWKSETQSDHIEFCAVPQDPEVNEPQSSQPRAEDMAEALKIGSGSFQHNLDHRVDEWLHIDMHSKWQQNLIEFMVLPNVSAHGDTFGKSCSLFSCCAKRHPRSRYQKQMLHTSVLLLHAC